MALSGSKRHQHHGESRRHHDKRRSHGRHAPKSKKLESSSATSSQALSVDALAKLNLLNQKGGSESAHYREKRRRRREEQREVQRHDAEETVVVEKARRQHKRKKRRIVSGSLLEEGNAKTLRSLKGLRGGEIKEDDEEWRRRRKKRILLGVGILILLLIIIIPVAIVASRKKSTSDSSSISSSDEGATPSNSELAGISMSDIPQEAKGTYLDPFSWYDTTDFNVTYTNETVGGLPVIGLKSDWDDRKSANQNTATLDTNWGSYGDTPARGVNLGGWLSLEPWITPSLFDYDSKLNVVDEWTLCEHLGPAGALSTLERHYATFVSEQTFIDIAAAGLDHVRIPYSYWTVAVYSSEPYVFRTSWRYLLRAIEWARKHGLRINLDLHGIPGSQNGWAHSGHQGPIGWLNGTDGSTNAQRSLDIHNQLSQFFAQDRYKNIIAFYGLVNEPKMTHLPISAVTSWTSQAYTLVRKNGIRAFIVFGDGFLGLEKWKGQLQGLDGLVLDAHQYVIFNKNLIVYNHTKKVDFACNTWTRQSEISLDTSTGFGPTIFAEWSQADTDCAPNLNNIGQGNRWAGTFDSGDPSTEVLSPGCPAKDSSCGCSSANAQPSSFSKSYKSFLQSFAEGQMTSFEKGWGWFYWTWKTESAPQWSYQAGLKGGFLPQLAYKPEFECSGDIPSFPGLPETY